MTNGTSAVVAGAWKSSRGCSINILEIRAVRLALENLSLSAGCVINLHIDNTSALYGLVKGRSPSFAMNAEIEKFLAIVKVKDLTIKSIAYIRSKHNPADLYSRLFED